MIWLTWRQHRKQALGTMAALAALAAFLIPTGTSMRSAYGRLSLDEFGDRYGSLVFVSVLLLIVPLLIGLFWGAPVVAREVEQGTHRMIWTQGISRRHWALVKCGLLGAAVTVFAIVYGAGLSWWYAPLSHIDVRQSRFTEVFFDLQGVAPVGYTLFAVALGVLAGTVVPKTLPAMALTLAGYTVSRLLVVLLARPHYQRPAVTDQVLGASTTAVPDGSWLLSSDVRQPDGTVVTTGSIRCPTGNTSCPAETGLGLQSGAYNHHILQPADRFWTFQLIEASLFVAIAALLLWFAVRRIRRIA